MSNDSNSYPLDDLRFNKQDTPDEDRNNYPDTRPRTPAPMAKGNYYTSAHVEGIVHSDPYVVYNDPTTQEQCEQHLSEIPGKDLAEIVRLHLTLELWHYVRFYRVLRNTTPYSVFKCHYNAEAARHFIACRLRRGLPMVAVGSLRTETEMLRDSRRVIHHPVIEVIRVYPRFSMVPRDSEFSQDGESTPDSDAVEGDA